VILFDMLVHKKIVPVVNTLKALTTGTFREELYYRNCLTTYCDTLDIGYFVLTVYYLLFF
jgi:hypothetical protein